MPLAVELDGVAFGYRPGQSVLEDVSLGIEGEFVRTPARTAAARRRSCGSSSASSGRRSGALPWARRRTAPRGGTRLGYLAQRSGAGGTRRRRSARSSAAARRRRASRPAAEARPRARVGGDRARGLRRRRRPAAAHAFGGMQQRAFIAKALPGSPRSSCSTSRRPASTPSRRSRSPVSSIACTRSSASRSCTSRTSSAPSRASSSASSSCAARSSSTARPATSPASGTTLARACSRVSSCGPRWVMAPSSASSRRPWASFSCSAASR